MLNVLEMFSRGFVKSSSAFQIKVVYICELKEEQPKTLKKFFLKLGKLE